MSIILRQILESHLMENSKLINSLFCSPSFFPLSFQSSGILKVTDPLGIRNYLRICTIWWLQPILSPHSLLLMTRQMPILFIISATVVQSQTFLETPTHFSTTIMLCTTGNYWNDGVHLLLWVSFLVKGSMACSRKSVLINISNKHMSMYPWASRYFPLLSASCRLKVRLNR